MTTIKTDDGDLLIECRCGSLNHIAALWFDHEDDYDEYGISHVIPWQPWRWRIQQAWRVLRGEAGHYAFVSMERADVERVVAHMQAYLALRDAKEAAAKPADPTWEGILSTLERTGGPNARRRALLEGPESYYGMTAASGATATAGLPTQNWFRTSSSADDDDAVWPAQPWRARLPGQDVAASPVIDPHAPQEKDWRP